jgi:heme/copper-type cytochrome/quinol oxidase subunit 1
MKSSKIKNTDDKSPPEREGEMREQDKEYLKSLRESEFQAIDQFDKVILALAGGAFGVSFAFLKDIVKANAVIGKNYLTCAWFFWCVSLGVNLLSFYLSHLSMRGAQRRYGGGEHDEAKLRGCSGKLVMICNPVSGVAFIIGLICMSIFVTRNLHDARDSQPAANNAQAATTTSTPAATATNTTATTGTDTSPRKHTGSP